MLGLGYSRFNAYHDTDADDSLVIMTGLVMSQPPPLPPDAAAATAPYPQPATFGRSWTMQGALEKLQASGRPTRAGAPISSAAAAAAAAAVTSATGGNSKLN